MNTTDLPENPALVVNKEVIYMDVSFFNNLINYLNFDCFHSLQVFCASVPLFRMHEDIEILKKEIKDSI